MPIDFNLGNYLRTRIDSPQQNTPSDPSSDMGNKNTSNIPSAQGDIQKANKQQSTAQDSPNKQKAQADSISKQNSEKASQEPKVPAEVEVTQPIAQEDGKGGFKEETQDKKEKSSFTDKIKQAAIERLMSKMSGDQPSSGDGKSPGLNAQGSPKEAKPNKGGAKPPENGSPTPTQMAPRGEVRYNQPRPFQPPKLPNVKMPKGPKLP